MDRSKPVSDTDDSRESGPEQGRSAAVDVGADLSGGRRADRDGADGAGGADATAGSSGFLGDGDTDDS